MSLLLIIATLFSAEVQLVPVSGSSDKLFYVLVDSRIYNGVESSLNQYAADLENEGYLVSIQNISGKTPVEIRWLLSSAWTNGLVGALLVGDIPEVLYEMDYCEHEEFPIDLFYTDLDGMWTDSDSDGLYDGHEGDVSPEIFVGRLKASNIDGDEIAMINNYFEKAHNYRTGTLALSQRALVYVDDDWVFDASKDNSSLRLAYDEVTLATDPSTTNSTDYEQRLTQGMGYEWVHLRCHGNPNEHTFKIPGVGWDGSVTSQDYRLFDLKAMFYQFFSCSLAKYTVTNNVANTIVMTTSYGLLVLGSTKIIWPPIQYDTLYSSIAHAQSIGTAFQLWFTGCGESPDAYYGYTIIGDPTLKITTVRNNGSGLGYRTIQGAVNAAQSGDAIYVKAGTYHEQVDVDKTLTIIGEDPTTTFVEGGGAGCVVTLRASGINFTRFSIRNGTVGVFVECGNNTYVSHIVPSNNCYGICLDQSSNNTVTANIVRNNCYGIYLNNSHGNAITANKVTENGRESTHAGIRLTGSQHNVISGNIVSNNIAYGIYAHTSPATRVVDNDIFWNIHGLHLYNSETAEDRCVVYHNNFFNNSETQVSRYGNSVYPSTWDDGYPSGGNFWSDYDGKDRDGDGIGDSHYKIDGQNKDRYPFMNPIAIDIVVINVTTCKTIVGQGYIVHVNTTVENQELFAKAFEVMVYANSTAIGSRTAVLGGGESVTLTFVWNTTGFSYGNYTVSASTGIFACTYSTLEDGTVLVTIPGDVNGDRMVTGADIGEISDHWWPGPPPGGWGYDPNVDINDDGMISGADLGIMSDHWGQSW